MKSFLLLQLLFISVWCFAQEADSVKSLEEIVVKAFAYEKPIKDVPAAVAKISTVDLERFNNTSFLPAFNIQPGVKMEERSPGSYRLSIRGSTIRSPFGVRNVKVYFNGMPLTDNGGNTYLNLLDFNSVDNLEIIKGPGSSLYGAGTGGVVLLNKNLYRKEKSSASISGGSYGMFRYNLAYYHNIGKAILGVNVSRQQADGYRDQSRMKRSIISIHSEIPTSPKSSLQINMLYSDLYYQTPGALTKIQYDTMPSMARPNAAAKKAAIYNQTFFGSVSWLNDWSDRITSNLTLFGNITDFKNPAILNYEKRDEKSFGFRNENFWQTKSGKLVIGAELQSGRSLINVGNNDQGNFVDAGNRVRLPTTIFFLFAQYDWNLPQGFFLTVGASLNQLKLKFETLGVNGYENTNSRNLGSILSPKIALLKKLNTNISTYISYSRGYSPPTTAEVFPSLAIYNPNLKSEYGNNYEFGMKGRWNHFSGSIALYSFQLNQTIIKLDSSGSDYFTNSGHTSQNGAELLWQYSNAGWRGWVSYSFNHYIFKEYKTDTNDYSGNQVTGVSPNTVSWGLDYTFKGAYINTTFNYVDRIPLNDANSVYANEYFLAGSRLGYRKSKGKIPFDLYTGVDNILNKKYSLGNDLNAFGGRYFNAAPQRNFYIGATFKFM